MEGRKNYGFFTVSGNPYQKIEDELTRQMERHSYRDCLIAVLCAKGFTYKDAEKFSKQNQLGCTTKDMNLAVALRNQISIHELYPLNDEWNLKKVIASLSTDEPLSIVNTEIKKTLLAAVVLVREIKKLIAENTSMNKDEPIISLFDDATRQNVDSLIKSSFECLKCTHSADLLFTRKDNTQIEYTVESPHTVYETMDGFSGRPYIPDGAGLFYDYGSDIITFESNKVIRDLSVAYIDDCGNILKIFDLPKNNEFSDFIEVPARYVLETTKGWFEQNHISAGDIVTIEKIITLD